MSIYTRRGDDGTTSLGTGERVSKAHPRVEAYGTVDEANSAVGLARVVVSDSLLEGMLRFIQHRLFNCSSSLAAPVAQHTDATPVITADDIRALEAAVDRLEARSDKLRGFVIESGCEAAARLHTARTAMRRAERSVVRLSETEPVADHLIEFLNRCSDVLFSGARWANALAGWPDETWDPNLMPPGSPE